MKRIYLPTALCAGTLIAFNGFAQEEHRHDHGFSLLDQINPELSLVLDANYWHEDSEEGMNHIKEELSGFGHGHAHEEHDHGQEGGFNLREIELYLSGEIDGYFRAETTLAFTSDEAEVETAYAETTALPWGLTLKGGKFFSDFGIVNAQHPHQWDFADQPLIYELALGDHGLNDTGVQASWQLDSPMFLQVGAETLQGRNERMFAYEGGDELPEHNGPRLGVGWIKLGPDLGHEHTLKFGFSGGRGIHQEIHEESVGTNSYLDGISWFAAADVLYQYVAHGEEGQGDITIQGEYFLRNKDLDLEASDDPAAPTGQHAVSRQDGYYIQALYGFLPRWRSGIRWEQVGLMNEAQEPDEAMESFDSSWRATAMLDFSPSAKSLIRLQLANGDYKTEDGTENIWEAYVQLVMTLGEHRHRDGHICSGNH